jgi:hypothetical protein
MCNTFRCEEVEGLHRQATVEIVQYSVTNQIRQCNSILRVTKDSLYSLKESAKIIGLKVPFERYCQSGIPCL